MKIAVVMTMTKAGGIEQTAVPYAVALRDQGHEVLLVLSKRSPFVSDARAEGLEPALITWPWGNYYPTNPLHARQIRRALRAFGPDAVIAHASKGLPQTRAAIGHSLPVLTRSGSTYAKDIAGLLVADRIIVTSDEMAEVAVGFGAERDRLSVVPNFFLGAPVAHDYALHSPVRIGALGRIVGRKGFDVLVDAAGLLKDQGIDAELTIHGLGSQQQPLIERAKALGIRASLPGWIGNADKGNFLEGLDIFVCPSRDEPFGNVYIDALKYGLPIVTSETVGSRYIFPGGEGAIVVPPGEPAAVADGIRRLINDPALRERLGRAGHVAFTERFSAAAAGPLLARAVERACDRFDAEKRS